MARTLTPIAFQSLPLKIIEVIASSRLDWFRAKSLEDLGIGNLGSFDNGNYLFKDLEGNFIEFK